VFGLGTGFINHLQIILISNYNTIANPHILKIIRAHAKSSQSAFTSRVLVTDLNKGDSSASVFTWLLSGEYGTTQLESESESYITTDGQSASLSWNKAPICGLRPDPYYCQTVVGLLMWGSFCCERTGLSLPIAAGPCQRSHSRVRSGPSPVCLVTIFYSFRFETSLFVASYHSHSCGGGIRYRLHTGNSTCSNCPTYIGTNCVKYTVSNGSSVVACGFVAVGTCLFEKAFLSKGCVLQHVQSLLCNGTVNYSIMQFVSRERIGKYIPPATNAHATIETVSKQRMGKHIKTGLFENGIFCSIYPKWL
jgi:hypothetical protein